jgi:hypothetical protein
MANPYLLVSQQTAADDRLPSVSTMVINDIFRPLGLSPSKLRQDRILDEARHTADPIHLMRVFGIAAETAMKYIYAAHPERRSTLSGVGELARFRRGDPAWRGLGRRHREPPRGRRQAVRPRP